MTLILTPEWLDSNSVRAFPLAADATQQDTTGAFQLPQDVLVDLWFPVHAGLDVLPGNFHLSQIVVSSTSFIVVLGYTPDAGPAVRAAVAIIDRPTFTPYSVHPLDGVGDFFDARGLLVLGRDKAIQKQPAGSFDFALADGRLEPEVIRPQLRGITGVYVKNGDNVLGPLVGDIILEAGRNTRLVVTQVLGQPAEVRVDFIDGEGSVAPCDCEDQESATAPCIRTINGMSTGSNFFLTGDACVSIDPREHGLQIGDSCSAPCAGCSPQQAVADALRTLEAKLKTVEDFSAQMSQSVAHTHDVLLATILHDEGCDDCSLDSLD